jgi:alpha(1,3/1,4) fucosyltransferase
MISLLNTKKRIKINFVDFWAGFDKVDNLFYDIISEDYEIEISDSPDYLIYSVFGNTHKNYNCVKIFFSGENIGPDFSECDYSMCFDWLDDTRHYRLPLYLLDKEYYNLVNKKVDYSLFDRKFCNFIVSNPHNQIRNDFFIKLSEYKKIDSGGSFLNNIGGKIGDKLKFQKEYKFSLTFENNAYRKTRLGYTTEKILDAMKANSIPIYWGNDWVDRDFNKKSFINYYDFNSEKEMIEYIIYLDNNREEYMRVLNEPWFINNEIPESNKKENIKSFLNKIFDK